MEGNKAIEPRPCANIDRKRTTGPRCQLPHSLHNTPTGLKTCYRSLTYEHTHALALTSVANGIVRVLQTDRSTLSATGCVTEREEKNKGRKKRRKVLCGEQWPQFRTHAAWGQLSPFFSPPPPPSAKSPPARASTGGKHKHGLRDTWIYYTTAVLFGETSSTAFKTTWLELQHCCLQMPPCVYCHQAILPNA